MIECKDHVSPSPSSIARCRSLEDPQALERTLSAIERTCADLVMQKPSFTLLYIAFFSFVTLCWEEPFRAQNTTFSCSLAFGTLFIVSFCFFMISVDFSMSFVIVKG
jgi:hypothetical protein